MTGAGDAVGRRAARRSRVAVLAVAALACWAIAARAEPTPATDGELITPEFAETVFKALAPLREADGCRLEGLETQRARFIVRLRTRSGAVHALEAATIGPDGAARTAGDWALSVPADLDRECGATMARVERVFSETVAPRRMGGFSFAPSIYAALDATFVLLVLGTAAVLVREVRNRHPSRYGIAALLVVWVIALALRLAISPRTFLHEYYHVAETAAGYLYGDIGPAYGKTGPAVFRLVAAALDRPHDVQVIFVTNAVLSSLAVVAVALFDLTLMGSWPRALCAAALLSVLPQHLRFSAAEDLFVQALTFGLWALALFALYLRTRRLGDALLAALAAALAMQTRPEMLFLPALMVALVLLVEPHSWRILFAGRTIAALLLLALLLIPRAFELRQALRDPPVPAVAFNLARYVENQLLFDRHVTPEPYWWVLGVGALWTLFRKPGLLVWTTLVFLGFSLFSFHMFDNPPYHVRTQVLPVSFTVLIGAGTASAWMALWPRWRPVGLAVGALALAVFGVVTVRSGWGFVTELRDQQLQWSFLERVVPDLPEQGTLLATANVGGRENLDAFPELLLQRARKRYRLVDVRDAARGDVEWPAPGEDVLFYQGMYCYFAFDFEPPPEPMSAPCLAVRERYDLEPLIVEDLHGRGYSWITYTGGGAGPFRVGFYRLVAKRPQPDAP